MANTKPEQVDESLEDSSPEEEEAEQKTPNKFLDFTNVLATLQSQRNTDKLGQLPPAVKRRIKALKKLQLETTNIEAKFFAEVHALECKYHKLYVPMYEKRNTIVTGAYEPTEEESQWPSDDEDETLGNQLKNKAKIEEEKTPEIIPKNPETNDVPDPTGIPNFWLTIFQNVNLLSEMIQPPDEPILSHLQDIKVDCSESPMSFTLSFHFSSNPYFTNSVLTKEYFMKCEPEEDDPFNFEGPEIYKCKGCTINWNKGMNVTLKTVKKKQKHKSRGVVRTVTKTVQNDSFFNFFAPPELPENAKGEEIDDELRQLLTTDFEIGHYIRERIVPRAVLFYTGEAIEDEDEDYEDDDDLEDTTEESDSDKEENDKAARDANCKQQ
ncbi:nucleosome assembly protein 1-like 1 [Tribolium castaneum]|uniref:Nucleosome assembly protein 1-like 1 n=1 Tax=Tribolium castaneum TaxID=7070 RepID=A0A139WJ25_TRICA|nr:PREDICTED: nucleosome assembly protein 1-like 1 [Tribolium castaneum]XP_008192050.1 PREDICTED: nucleosome assembly protein 1-like 1 [Tribolium castaneum]KYB27922.1 Nucleosome assembly protein 1-like 1 [Tribolium castaneum]|eukprot:XP_008192049.1 PREDICTED: nucleosome assembly protein 1-like 1 [Tribolium castaneum]